ncbi:bifunctional riboflavin kinase/FAD synthetase [Agathobacter sp.]
MEYITKTLDFHVDEPSVISFGKFDGLHRGHEFLMEKQIEQSNLHGYKRIIFTFDIPPRSEVLGIESKVIITNDEKEYVFDESGVDYLIECPFVPEVMNMEADAFVRWVVKNLNVKCIVVGDDFHFGHNRAGDHHLLAKMAGEMGYELIVVDKIKDGERDISSTYIREEIAAGHIRKANDLLGYPFFIKGKVVHGRQLGRTIGIPTVNLTVSQEKLLPPNGVYMTKVLVKDNWYLGVTNIGCKPTISGENPIGAETYIIDFSQDVYGQEIMVELHEFIRPEMKFDSIEELKSQMSADINRTIRYAAGHTL